VFAPAEEPLPLSISQVSGKTYVFAHRFYFKIRSISDL
jgi:hypothetical protein